MNLPVGQPTPINIWGSLRYESCRRATGENQHQNCADYREYPAMHTALSVKTSLLCVHALTDRGSPAPQTTAECENVNQRYK
jgi:hypothetical protein